jgi:anti-anti-sigma factor
MKESSMEIELRDGFTWIILPGTLNIRNCEYIEQQIEASLEGKSNHIVLDLIYFQQMHSTLINLILRLYKHFAEKGGLFYLVNVSDKCCDYLFTVHLDKVIQFFKTELEFEIWHEKNAREQKPPADSNRFMCATIIENGICHIDLSGVMRAGQNVVQCISKIFQKEITHYVFNLTSLDTIDSNSAYFLRDLIFDCNKNDAQCVAYGSNKAVAWVLKLLSIDKIMPLYDDKQKALDALGKT